MLTCVDDQDMDAIVIQKNNNSSTVVLKSAHTLFLEYDTDRARWQLCPRLNPKYLVFIDDGGRLIS